MTIKISQLPNVSTVIGNIIVPVVSNVAGTLTTVQANVDQLGSYILGSLPSNVSSLTTTVATHTTNINTLIANAGIQSGNIAIITANLGAVSGSLATLTANAGAQSGNVATIFANLGAVSGSLASISANVANANVGMLGYVNSVTTSIRSNATTLSTNVAMQYTAIGNITSGTATFSNLIPFADATYQLGTNSNRWKDAYISGNINLNTGAKLSANTSFIISSLPLYAPNVSAGNVNISGTITASSLNVSNIYAQTSNPTYVVFADNSVQSTAYTATLANSTPASSTAAGTKGDIRYDISYVYICVAANTWIRTARVSW